MRRTETPPFNIYNLMNKITMITISSADLDSIVMGNHEELKDVNIISTIFVDSTESYNIKTTFVDKYLLLDC